MINYTEKQLKLIVEKLENAMSDCDYASREAFLKTIFKVISKNLGLENKITLRYLNRKDDYFKNGEFNHITDEIYINDKYLQPDKRQDELKNNWCIPSKMVICVLHELKHCLDYHTSQLYTFKKDALRFIGEENLKYCYIVNPSERDARRFSLCEAQNLFTQICDYCSKVNNNYLQVFCKGYIMPWIEKCFEATKKEYEEAYQRLEWSGVDLLDVLKVKQSDYCPFEIKSKNNLQF